MSSIREQVIAAFADKVGAVRAPLPADFDDKVAWPITGLVDGDDLVERVEYGSYFVILGIRLERIDEYTGANALARYGSEDKSVVGNALLTDLISTALAGDRTLGGLAVDTQYSEGGVIYADTSSRLVGAFAVFNLRFRFDVGDPLTDSAAE